MKTTRRRYWVFFLLFLFNLIAYVDRVNMSVAGKPIAQEFGLSPVALGYLFSSFLWAYVLMMLPGGRLIDRWGAHVMRVCRDRGMVGGADGDRRGLELCDDAGDAARPRDRRGARSRRSPTAASGPGRPIPSAGRRSARSRRAPAWGWRSARRLWPG